MPRPKTSSLPLCHAFIQIFLSFVFSSIFHHYFGHYSLCYQKKNYYSELILLEFLHKKITGQNFLLSFFSKITAKTNIILQFQVLHDLCGKFLFDFFKIQEIHACCRCRHFFHHLLNRNQI